MAHQYSQRVACSLVTVTIGAIWLLSGVTLGEGVRYVMFETLYVVLPGCLLYRVLSLNSGGLLRTVAIGWPLGYAIEVGAFALSATLSMRELFIFLPLVNVALVVELLRRSSKTIVSLGNCRTKLLDVVGSGSACLLHKRNVTWRSSAVGGKIIERTAILRDFVKPEGGQRFPRGSGLNLTNRGRTRAPSFARFESVFVAMAICVVLVLFALRSFTISPLPGHFHSVAYMTEGVLPISLAAEARYHWPITTPWVIGLPLHYYTGVFIHGAAINQVTGVALSTIYLRLFPTIATLLVALQLLSIGRSMGRSRLTGLLAIILFFVVGAATLNPTRAWPFEGNSLGTFWVSATFTFGVVFLLALLSVMQHWLTDTRSPTGRIAGVGSRSRLRSDGGALILMAMLVLGCGAAKIFAAVDFVGGLALFWIWSIATRKSVRLLPYALAVSTICVGAIYIVMLAGGGSKVQVIGPFNTLLAESVFMQIHELVQSLVGSSALWVLFFMGAVIVIIASLSAPVLGILWILLRRRALSSFEVFCVAVLLAGLVCYDVTFGGFDGAEIYFRLFAYLGLVPLAAAGLADFWNDTPTSARPVIVGACGVVLIVGLGIAGGLHLFISGGQGDRMWYVPAYGLVGGMVILIAVRLNGHYASMIFSHRGRIVACCIPLLGVLGLIRPVTHAMVSAEATILHQRIAPLDSPSVYGMTGALYRGLVWVRAHTRACDVLAVNNHYGAASSDVRSAYLYYSAFTERRIFLESWGFTSSGVLGREPFPGRLALNDSAVVHGDISALRELGRKGVSYVLVDKTHRRGAVEPRTVSRQIFSNAALDVYRLLPGVSAGHTRFGCDAGSAR